ncbi:unnamed protein product, partial [marine sediment metagenome]
YQDKEKTPKSTSHHKKFIIFDAINLLLPNSQRLMHDVLEQSKNKKKILLVKGKFFQRYVLSFEPDKEISIKEFVEKTKKIPQVLRYMSKKYKKGYPTSQKPLWLAYSLTLKRNNLKFGANIVLKIDKEDVIIKYDSYKNKPLIEISAKKISSLKKTAKLLIKYLN